MIRVFTPARRKSAGHWLAELAIVVAGVLIALYAQQWDSARKLKRDARDAEQRIGREVMFNLGIATEREMVGKCIDDRLGAVADRLDRGATDWKSFAKSQQTDLASSVPHVVIMPSRNWAFDAYHGAVSSGSLDGLPLQRQARLAQIYGLFENLAKVNREEFELQSELNGLALSSTPVRDRDAYFRMIAKLANYNAFMRLLPGQLRDDVKDLGYSADAETREVVRLRLSNSQARGLPRFRRLYGDCIDPHAYDGWLKLNALAPVAPTR